MKDVINAMNVEVIVVNTLLINRVEINNINDIKPIIGIFITIISIIL